VHLHPANENQSSDHDAEQQSDQNRQHERKLDRCQSSVA
jgi:hypothetical protein